MTTHGVTQEELDALRFHQWCGQGTPGPGDRRTSYACDCSPDQAALVESAIAKLAAPPLFTQEDVEVLRAKAADAMLYTYEPTAPDPAGAVWFNRLADRIAALLPPATP